MAKNYRLRVQLNDSNCVFLEEYKSLRILLRQELPEKLTHKPYLDLKSMNDGVQGGTFSMEAGKQREIYFRSIPDER